MDVISATFPNFFSDGSKVKKGEITKSSTEQTSNQDSDFLLNLSAKNLVD